MPCQSFIFLFRMTKPKFITYQFFKPIKSKTRLSQVKSYVVKSSHIMSSQTKPVHARSNQYQSKPGKSTQSIQVKLNQVTSIQTKSSQFKHSLVNSNTVNSSQVNHNPSCETESVVNPFQCKSNKKSSQVIPSQIK